MNLNKYIFAIRVNVKYSEKFFKNNMIRSTLLTGISIFALHTTVLFAQEHSTVSGHIYDANKQPVVSATIRLGELETQSDQQGYFSFAKSPSGKYQLKVSALGYVTQEKQLERKNGQQITIEVLLIQTSTTLDEAQVEGHTHQRQRLQPIKSTLIDARAVSTQATSLTELMNRAPGIRIRQSGGTGSNPDVSVNGFQGKAIKYFKDGIPLDYLGDGYSIATMPLEAIDHIEVYRGILPIYLGSDALGGAINLVPRKTNGTQTNAYYEIGSFNSHRLGVKSSKSSKDNRWLFGGEMYYNYAKNNYKATVEVPDPLTKNPELVRLPFFHNGSKHLYGEVFAQLQNRNWADELRISLIGFDLAREQQHPAMMTDAYGAVRSKQYTLAPSLRYKKALLNDKLHFDQFVSYNNLQTERIDTLRGSYDWYGDFTPKTTIGETRLPSQSHINEHQVVSRSNLSYRINTHTQLGLNYVFTQVNRRGADPYGPKLEETGLDVLQLKSTYKKQVLGLSLDNYWFDEKLQNQLMAKYYNYNASGIQNTWLSANVGEKDKRTVSGNYWSLANAIRYRLNTTSLFRLGGEYTYRLPEREELFGNNIFIVPNFELKPEQSLNFNLGYQQTLFSSLDIEANVFYRRTKNQILLVTIDAPNAQYKNQENVRGYGFDIDLNYRFWKNYRFNTNATWTNLRLYGITSEKDQWMNDARLRNTPYFFANVGLQGSYENLFRGSDKLDLFFNYNFMREFYLETIPKSWEPNGFLGLSGNANINSNLIIPNQHLLNGGFTYNPSYRGFTIGAEVRNMLNKNLYDYYRIQRAGRSFYLKLSYQIP
ncbi:hypothetical protein A9970_22570 [Sphingobacterium sp. UME9]|nr:hypothetical protein [Sphingobacterium sp. UME9]